MCDDRDMNPLSSVGAHRWKGNHFSRFVLSNKTIMWATNEFKIF